MKKFHTILVTLLTIMVLGCYSDETTNPTVIESTTPPSNLKFLALGDSYTIGQSVPPEERWPAQLVDSLAWGFDSVRVLAKTGWTTQDLLGVVFQIDSASFDLVTLQIGVNNQFRGWDFEIFQTQFDSLIQLSILYAGSRDRVITLSIPDYGYTPFGANNQVKISQELDQYNTYIQEKSKELGIDFINITDISRSPKGTLAEDQLHPSAEQYSLWVAKLLPVVRAKFE